MVAICAWEEKKNTVLYKKWLQRHKKGRFEQIHNGLVLESASDFWNLLKYLQQQFIPYHKRYFNEEGRVSC